MKLAKSFMETIKILHILHVLVSINFKLVIYNGHIYSIFIFIYSIRLEHL